MINQSPQAKLNSQVQSNTQGANTQANQKSSLGKPSINRPKATPVAPPQVNAGEAPERGFSDWVGDKWSRGKEWAKDKAWNYAMGKASDKMQSTMNPDGQPGKGQPASPGAPGSPTAQRPKANQPTPNVPKLGGTPTPKVPKPQIPKFRR